MVSYMVRVLQTVEDTYHQHGVICDLEMCFTVGSLSQDMEFCRRKVTDTGVLAVPWKGMEGNRALCTQFCVTRCLNRKEMWCSNEVYTVKTINTA